VANTPQPQAIPDKADEKPGPAQVDVDEKQATPIDDSSAAITPQPQAIPDKADEKPEPPQPVEIISEPEPQKSVPTAINTPEKSVSNNTGTADGLKVMLDKYKIKDKTWIMEQSASSMTAQMMASSKPDALIRQAKNPALQGQVAIYHILRKNKDWYVLVFGSHKDKASMRKAVDDLPTALKKGKPWLRPMSAIQAEIQAGKK
jgi:septal ring-binding cell division protein DamX